MIIIVMAGFSYIRALQPRTSLCWPQSRNAGTSTSSTTTYTGGSMAARGSAHAMAQGAQASPACQVAC